MIKYNKLKNNLLQFFGLSKPTNSQKTDSVYLQGKAKQKEEQTVFEVQPLNTTELQNKATKKSKGKQELCPSAYACGARMYLGNR